MKLKCIIVDDEPVARRVLQEFAEDIEFLELCGIAGNAVQAVSLLNKNDIDIVYLDINMPKINGIDFLKNSRITAHVVITTAYPTYAVEAYGLDVVDYLVKPIAFDRFLKSCLKVKDLRSKNPAMLPPAIRGDDHFFIKVDNQIEKVLYNDLLYAEAMMNYIMLHTETKNLMVYLTIKTLEEQLPPELFMRVHKSYLVNKSKVQRIEGNVLHLGEQKITISQNLKDKVVKDITAGKMIRR